MTTENDAVAELTRESQRFGAIRNPDSTGVQVNVTRDGERVNIDSLERYRESPRRYRGDSIVRDVASFAQLLAMDEHYGATIFANDQSGNLTAIVNYHGWRDHRVILALKLAPQFERWQARNGKMVSQAEFAELIEDSLADIASPPAADMLELAQTFQAITNVDFESGQRSSSGAVRFRYVESVDARAGAGGELSVPESFTLQIPVFQGGAHVELRAALRYRIGRDGLRLGFKIAALDDALRAAFEDVVDGVTATLATGAGDHTLVYGPAPAAISPLA